MFRLIKGILLGTTIYVLGHYIVKKIDMFNVKFNPAQKAKNLFNNIKQLSKEKIN